MRPRSHSLAPQGPQTRRERGANMVEFAIIAPIVALIVMGLLELGLAWRDSLTVATAARSGARVGSNLGPERLADYETLQGVLAAIADIDDSQVELIVVYDATADPDPHPDCIDSTPSSRSFTNASSRACNVYDKTFLSTISTADFSSITLPSGDEYCDPGAIDHYWCPIDRKYPTQHDLGYFGVYVQTTYKSITKILPIGDLTIEDKTVMRVEPRLEATGP